MILKKFCFPFLLVPIVIVLFSCSKEKKNNSQRYPPVVDSINMHIQNSEIETDTTKEFRLKEINLAERLADQNNIDSLRLKTMKTKATLLNSYYPDSAKAYIEKYIKLSRTKKDTFHLGNAIRNLGLYNHYHANNDKDALICLDEAKIIFENKKDSLEVVYTQLLISDVLEKSNAYFEMESINTDALDFLKNSDMTYYYEIIYNNFGISYRNTYDFDSSLKYYNLAYKLSEDKENKAIIANNIGLTLISKGDYEAAIAVLKKTEKQTSNSSTQAKILDNLGLAYFRMKDNKSLEYFKKGYDLRKSNQIKDDLIISSIHLSDYYKDTDPGLSKKYALEAYQGATDINRIDDRLEALKLLTGLSSGMESRQYFFRYSTLNDSITKVRQSNKNTFAKNKYDYKEAKASEAEKSLQLAKSENQRLVMAFVIFVVVLIVFIMYWRHKKEKQLTAVRNEARLQNEKQLEKYKTETRLSKKVHDELANDVFNTMTFAELKDLSDKDNKEVLLNYLDKIYKGSRNISRENSSVDTGVNYPDQLRDVIKGYKSDAVNVMSNGIDTIDWNATEPGKKIVVYRVLQELLVNMKKHSKSTIVVIRFQMNDDKIQIDYSDNGIGIAKNDLTLKNGLQNVETRIESINGTYTFESVPEKGFKVSFSFPK